MIFVEYLAKSYVPVSICEMMHYRDMIQIHELPFHKSVFKCFITRNFVGNEIWGKFFVFDCLIL